MMMLKPDTSKNAFIDSLINAYGNPKKTTFGKRVQRRASRLGTNSNVALIILAAEKGLGYQRELSKLSPQDQQKVYDTLSNKPSRLGSIVTSVKETKISVSLKTSLGTTIHDPFIPEISTKAKEMAEKAYPLFYVFENSIRNFIILVMNKEIGNNWWTNSMNSVKLQDIVKEVDKRIKNEADFYWHGRRGAHAIYYTDFADLITIINSHKAIFNKYFKGVRGQAEWLLSKLSDIMPSRNVSSHHNRLTEKDIRRTETYLIDWLSQLDYIKDQGFLN